MSSNDAFVPKDLVERNMSAAGSTAKIMLYPVTQRNWPEAEKAHSIHSASSILIQQTSMTNEEKLRNLGVCTNSQSTVMAIMGSFKRKFGRSQFDFTNLTILGFYDNNGALIANCSTDADSSILKPVQDGIVADCRPANVKFVKVRNECDYSGQITVAHQRVRILPAKYYVELYQSTKSVTGGSGQVCQVTTWH